MSSYRRRIVIADSSDEEDDGNVSDSSSDVSWPSSNKPASVPKKSSSISALDRSAKVASFPKTKEKDFSETILSDSDSSFERNLSQLCISQPKKPPPQAKKDDLSLSSSSSSPSSSSSSYTSNEFKSDRSYPSLHRNPNTNKSLKKQTELPKTASHKNPPVSNDELVGTAWDYDSTSDEYWLSTKKQTEVKWPNIRIPSVLFARLYDYQRTGVHWMASLHENGIGGILGDDMGMGKTFMTLTLLGGLMRARTIRNALIVAPLSVLRSWEKEAKQVLLKCAPKARILVVNSEMSKTQRDRELKMALESSYSRPYLIISTYGLVRSATKSFAGADDDHWDYVVVDEGHQIKNPNSEVARSCRSICRNSDTHRLMLTGTPIMNNLKELWSLFDWATSGQILGPFKRFNNYYANPIEGARDKNASDWMIKTGQKVNKELQDVLKPYFLQRLKVDFLKDKLPVKTDLVVWTHLSAKQRATYSEFIEAKDSIVKSILSGAVRSPLEAITWLKKLCGHPLLADKQDENTVQSFTGQSSESLISQSAKLGILVTLINKLRQDGHRTLIFSQSTKMLDIIEKVLGEKSVKISRIDGGTREKDRQRFVDDFNCDKGKMEVMLLSTKAAGVGLTLVGADRVIIYDPSWTPAEDSQAVDRCYRIGQKRPVQVYRLIAAGTVEEKMYEKQVHKDGIRRTVLTSSEDIVQRYFDRNELRNLFKLAPAGECAVMDKVHQETKGQSTDWTDHDFLLSYPGVVGITRHDGFYSHSNEAREDDADNEVIVTFDGKTPAKKVLGRAQRVLQNDEMKAKANNQKIRQTSPENNQESSKENTPNSFTTQRTTVNRDFSASSEQSKPQSVSSILNKADNQLASSHPRRAMKTMLDAMENRYSDMTPQDKILFHGKISQTAHELGLLED